MYRSLDASNVYDEEVVDVKEMYFSDDEEERRVKQKAKNKSNRNDRDMERLPKPQGSRSHHRNSGSSHNMRKQHNYNQLNRTRPNQYLNNPSHTWNEQQHHGDQYNYFATGGGLYGQPTQHFGSEPNMTNPPQYQFYNLQQPQSHLNQFVPPPPPPPPPPPQIPPPPPPPSSVLPSQMQTNSPFMNNKLPFLQSGPLQQQHTSWNTATAYLQNHHPGVPQPNNASFVVSYHQPHNEEYKNNVNANDQQHDDPKNDTVYYNY